MRVDVVYLVRRGERNEELRHSLRTLRNVDHDNVWTVGYSPSWVQGVKHLDGNRTHHTSLNVFGNLLIACECDELSDDIIVMNDDFMVLRRWAPENVYRCTLEEHLSIVAGRRDSWAKSLRFTHQWLAGEGVTDPLSYELHRPVVINRSKMLDVLTTVGDFGSPFPPQWRTVYGNLHSQRPDQVRDCKVKSWSTRCERADVISTDDASWPQIAQHIVRRFPHPSPYEVTP